MINVDVVIGLPMRMTGILKTSEKKMNEAVMNCKRLKKRASPSLRRQGLFSQNCMEKESHGTKPKRFKQIFSG